MLQALGVSAAAGLAGCGGRGGGSTSTNTDSGGGGDSGGDGGGGDSGDSGLPSQSEAVEEWGQRINEYARESGIDWQQFEGTSLIFGMNVHPFTSVTEPLLPYFEELTGISVTYNTFPEDQLWQKLTLDLNNESGVFDGFFLGLWPSARYHNAGWVKDLNQYINDSSLTDQDWLATGDWPESALNAFTYGDGDLISLPFGVEAYGAVAYDVPSVEAVGMEPPSSYPELRDLAQAIHESDEVDRAGIASRASSTTLSSANWATVFKSYDAEWIDYDAREATLNSDRGIASLEIFAEMMGDYGPADIGNFDWYRSNQAMGNGDVGMALHTPSAIGPWTQEQIDRTEWLPPLPGPDGTQLASTWEWGLGISEYTENPNAAWLFLQWALSRPMMLLTNTQQWEGQAVYGPARSNWLFEQDEYQELGPKESWNEAHRQGMEMVPSDPPPVPLHTPQNMDMMTEAAIAMNNAVTDSKSASEALDDAAPPITEYAKEIPEAYL
ncbi:ABC transporter substrate-binding protein [Halobellus rarus]|uniref:ABC transporter substrate-binding protein n=1 Tax=Halobellus rarus TaxID=1126237 RepID=A0ABD6CSF9_9EURY|nr:extracellular solute-binding protein [Halobellus rarus]